MRWAVLIRAAAALVAAAIVLLSLLPVPPPALARFPLADKFAHALAYLVLSFLLFAAQAPGPRLRALLIAIGASFLLGGVIELVQPLSMRRRELADLAADLLGSAAGGLLALAWSDRLRRLLSGNARD